MDELKADFNQFSLDGGTVACTAIALCFSRLGLEGAPLDTKAPLHRAMRAGAFLCKCWMATPEYRRDGLQCWTDVRRVFPELFDGGMRRTFECNGFFGRAAPRTNPRLYATFSDALDHLAAFGPDGRDEGRAGVLTTGGGSYGLLRRPETDGVYWYLFDSHGRHGGGATLRRSVHAAAFKRYVVRELLPFASERHQEFQVAVFAGPGRTTGT
jgi:hypothetical protein